MAEFGHAIALMRQYLELAEGGCGWLIVAAGEDKRIELITHVAKRAGASLATRYGHLVIEDLL